MNEMDELEALLSYRFQDQQLLLRALTHRSWLEEERGQGRARDLQDQQRLEFLGDAFIGYSVGRNLYEQHPEAGEGSLTKMRSSTVDKAHLTAVGQQLDLKRWIRLGRGEASRISVNKQVLEDTVEAIVGAVLLDGGERPAHALVRHLILESGITRAGNAISVFYELWQAKHHTKPPEVLYERIGGTDNAPLWEARLKLPSGQGLVGQGSTKSAAKEFVCGEALDVLAGSSETE